MYVLLSIVADDDDGYYLYCYVVAVKSVDYCDFFLFDYFVKISRCLYVKEILLLFAFCCSLLLY